MTSKTLQQWTSLSRLPLGGRVFSWLIGRVVPYAGTVHPEVEALDEGYARVAMGDRRGVRNHLSSIHAVATVNLGEMAANMALMSRQPDDGRWIVTGLDAKYLKKARGRITAECHVPDVNWQASADLDGVATLKDSNGDIVTEVHVHWRVGPRK